VRREEREEERRAAAMCRAHFRVEAEGMGRDAFPAVWRRCGVPRDSEVLFVTENEPTQKLCGESAA